MKLKLAAAAVVTGLMAVSLVAKDVSPDIVVPTAPDKAKLSYAVGMRMGMQLIQVSTNVDADVAIRAVQDVLEGKPTMLQESQLAPVLNREQAIKRGEITVTPEQAEKDKAEFSYAGGMRIALLYKHSGVDVDPQVITQAIQDTLQGKPKMKTSEIPPLFIQAQKYALAKKTSTNVTEGEAFLAKNAKQPGIQVLPDGLQYQIIQPGTGPLAKPDDLIFIKFSGTFINGVEFDHHPHFLTRITGGIQGWKDVLPRMKVGAKWRIFVPSNLAFGHEGESFHGVGPDATVIYDLEMISIAPPGGNYEINSGLGHGLDVGVPPSNSNSDK